MLSSSRLLVLLAASATALNLGAPVLRSTRPTLRRVRTGRFAQAPRYLALAPPREPPRACLWQPLAVMQVEEEAMTEEEYEAELAAQEAAKTANVKEEEDILTPQEVEAMKAKIANYAPWMTVDPEARARAVALTPATVTRAARRHAPGPARPRRPLRGRRATLLLASATPRPPSPALAAQAIARAKKAREDRKNAAPTQIDGMQLDPQAAELNAAGGLKSKVLSEDEIELRWETSDETGQHPNPNPNPNPHPDPNPNPSPDPNPHQATRASSCSGGRAARPTSRTSRASRASRRSRPRASRAAPTSTSTRTPACSRARASAASYPNPSWTRSRSRTPPVARSLTLTLTLTPN